MKQNLIFFSFSQKATTGPLLYGVCVSAHMVAIAPEVVVLALRVQVSFLLDALISVAIHAAIPSRLVILPLRPFCLLMLVGELPVVEQQ